MFASRFVAACLLGLVVGTSPVWTPSVRAQPADTLTVDAAVQEALRNNRTLRAAQADVNVAAADVWAERSTWFPTLTSTASYQRLSDVPDLTVEVPGFSDPSGDTFTFADALRDRYTLRVGAEQTLFTGLRRAHTLDAAQHQTAAARARSDAVRADVAFGVREAYWRLYEARARVDAASDALRVLDRERTDVGNRRDVGMATDADVLAVEARQASVRLERLRAEHAVTQAQLDLSERMGRSTRSNVVPADTVVVHEIATEPARDLDAMIRQALAQNPEVTALQRTGRALDATVSATRSGWFPTVVASAAYLYANPNERIFPPEDAFQGTWEAGVTAQWTLSLGGRTLADTDRAQARRDQNRHRLADQRQRLAVEVERQHLALTQAVAAVAAARTSERAAKASLDAARSRAREGMASIATVLDAEQTLRRAQADRAGAEAAYATARAALARTLGTGE